MQIKGLHRSIYRAYWKESKIAFVDRYKELWQHLLKATHSYETSKEEKFSNQARKEFGIISKATYYRYQRKLQDLNNHIPPPRRGPIQARKPKWSQELVGLVLLLRKSHPTFGKKKLQIILARDYKLTTSESTVGRILKVLMARGLIAKYPALIKTKRPRVFKGHAKPWSFKAYQELKIGERVEIDHMVVTKNNKTLRHFQAWDRKTKFILASIYTNATSHSAKLALEKFIQEAPFKISSIQVDGGSEFRAEFEQECAKLGIELLVLPPRRPTFNGGVERGNRTFREEFYNLHNDLFDQGIEEIRKELDKAVYIYNNYRPHQNLNGATPMGYIRECRGESQI